jgi:hypothetical protein
MCLHFIYTKIYTVFNATLSFSFLFTNKKEKLKVALKTVYFSVYEVYIKVTGSLNIIFMCLVQTAIMWPRIMSNKGHL